MNNRIIKFRAYNKEIKKMYDSFSPWNISDAIKFELFSGQAVPMQFTGLHDKNGNEIFEGDILKGKNLENFDEIAEVKWDFCQWYPLAGHRAFDECKIIGNIYENGDLIKEI